MVFLPYLTSLEKERLMAQRTDRAASFGQNLYLDTRGAAGKPVPFTAAVVNGLAAGGGL